MKLFKSLNKKTASATLIAMLAAGSANAALPADAQAAVDSIATLATDILAAIWPIVVTLLVGFVGIKLTKKGVNKAT